MPWIIQFLQAHWAVIGSGLVAIVLAEAQTMPPPGTTLSWETLYTWQYDAIQTLLPIRQRPNYKKDFNEKPTS